MALRLSFNLSGIDPNAPTTTGITFVLTPHIFIIIIIIIIISSSSSSSSSSISCSNHDIMTYMI